MRNFDKVFEEMVNKMVEKHGTTMKELVDTKDQTWFTRFTWTENEQDEFRTWAEKKLVKECRMHKEKARKEMTWFLVAYGLRIER